MLRKTGLGLLCAALGLALAACGSARVIQRTQYGGIIALQGDRGKAMEQAHKEMSAHCGANNYQIVQEGEEAIGTDTFQNSNTNYGEHTDTATAGGSATQNNPNGSNTAYAEGTSSNTQGGANTQTTTSTRTATEWRVHYQCNGAPGGAPMPSAPPPPPPPGG